MGVRPKKFMCENCSREYYIDTAECPGCHATDTMKPIPKQAYKCYLNGILYGAGDLEYMNELFRDYVVTNKMYGKLSCDFKIEKVEE